MVEGHGRNKAVQFIVVGKQSRETAPEKKRRDQIQFPRSFLHAPDTP